MAAAIRTVRAAASSQPVVRLAFESLVLTAVRSGEARLATWTEISVADRVWTIPAMRMKAKREHRVPLCGRALELLDAARKLGVSPAEVAAWRAKAAAANVPLSDPMRQAMARTRTCTAAGLVKPGAEGGAASPCHFDVCTHQVCWLMITNVMSQPFSGLSSGAP